MKERCPAAWAANLPMGWENAEIDAAAYVDMLRSAYQAAKNLNRNVVVVSAGLAPTQGGDGAVNDLTFLRQMYAAGLNDVADVVGMNGLGFASSPDDRSDPNGYNFSRLEQLRQIMVDNGGAAKPAWALEVGWVADVPEDLGGFNWWKVSETRQAQYLKRAIEKANVQWPWLDGLFIWNLNFRYHSPQPEKSAFAIENRLAYQCVSQMQPPPAICDALPPAISLIRESADPINQQGCSAPTTVTIRAEVSDASGVAWVRLHYQPPQGSWMQVAMARGQGDTYEATLGPFGLPGALTYYLQAQDGEGYEQQSYPGTVTVNGCADYCVDLRVPGFDPERDGLRFQNFFPRAEGGIYVGMSLAVLDYFTTVTATLPITYNRWEGPRTWNPANPLQAYVIWRHLNNLRAVSAYERQSKLAQPLKEQRNALEFESVRRAIVQDNVPVVLGLANERLLEDKHGVVAYGIHDCPARSEFWIDVHDSNTTTEEHVGLGQILLRRTAGSPEPGITVTPYDSEGYDQLYALSPNAVQAIAPDTAYGGAAVQAHAVLYSQAATTMREQGYIPRAVYGGNLDQGASSAPYAVTARAGSSFAVLAHWGGSILKLSLYRPDGSLYWAKQSIWPPLMAGVANAQEGTWTFRVTAVDVPAADYPYVAVVGTKERGIVYLPLLMRR